MAKGKKTSVDVPNSTVDAGYTGKGEPDASAGQRLISSIVGAPSASIVFGANNLKKIYMRKKKAGIGYEYEAAAVASVDAKKTAGWEVVSGSSFPVRTIQSSVTNTSLAGSKILNVKLTPSVTYQWNQQAEAYGKVPADARTALGQLDGPGTTKAEVVQRASAFIFKEIYAGIPAGTLITLKGIRGRYRYAAATDASGGIYTSFADGDK